MLQCYYRFIFIHSLKNKTKSLLLVSSCLTSPNFVIARRHQQLLSATKTASIEVSRFCKMAAASTNTTTTTTVYACSSNSDDDNKNKEISSPPVRRSLLLCPPASVRGMTMLDRNAFTIQVDLPTIYVPANRSVSEVGLKLKRLDLLLKYRLKSARKRRLIGDARDGDWESSKRSADANSSHSDDGDDEDCRRNYNSAANRKSASDHQSSLSSSSADCCLVPIVLNPEKVSAQEGLKSLPEEVVHFLAKYGITSSTNYRMVPTTIDYLVWTKEDIFRAVLPEGEHTVSGYSIVGHIVHVNLKESLYAFKNLIGQVLLDKVPQAKTVINKRKNIDSAYRNFEIELLAGEKNFKTRVKENGCLFDLDYSNVYWNSRLSTEHKRVVDLVEPGDVVIDVFAGIGPFTVPVARSKNNTSKANAPVFVIANDLNPESCFWLKHNAVLNKVPHALLSVHNLDAAELIRTVVKTKLEQFLLQHSTAAAQQQDSKVHIIMNLPATAVTFLPCFLGLLSSSDFCSGVDLPHQLPETVIANATNDGSSSESSGNNNNKNDTSCKKNCIVNSNSVKSSSLLLASDSVAVIEKEEKTKDDDDDKKQLVVEDEPTTSSSASQLPVFLYVYTFSRCKQDPMNDAIRQVCDALHLSFPANPALIMAHDVRNVAPNKQMICVQVQLTKQILYSPPPPPPPSSPVKT